MDIPKLLSKAAPVALAIALLAAAAEVLVGPGYRFGIWHYSAGFLAMRYATYGAFAAASLSVLALGYGFFGKPAIRHTGKAILALVIAAVVFYFPYNMRQTAMSLPFIHDITTDTDYPPDFVDILPLRADASNSATYEGPELAAQQKKGYPDLATLVLASSPAEAFTKAERAVTAMGWELVASVASEGRIEATATTPWWGFKDDVVIRIGNRGDGSAVDVRSVSRVGKSDLGANAARIKAFLGLMK